MLVPCESAGCRKFVLPAGLQAHHGELHPHCRVQLGGGQEAQGFMPQVRNLCQSCDIGSVMCQHVLKASEFGQLGDQSIKAACICVLHGQLQLKSSKMHQAFCTATACWSVLQTEAAKSLLAVLASATQILGGSWRGAIQTRIKVCEAAGRQTDMLLALNVKVVNEADAQ